MSIIEAVEYWGSVLEPLTIDNTIQGVYTYMPGIIENGPYVCIFPTSGVERYRDSCENDVTHTIMIKVINNNIDNKPESEAITVATVDKILDIIRKNDIVQYKDISIDKSTPSWTWGRIDAQYKSRVCDISIDTFISYNTK